MPIPSSRDYMGTVVKLTILVICVFECHINFSKKAFLNRFIHSNTTDIIQQSGLRDLLIFGHSIGCEQASKVGLVNSHKLKP